MEDSIGPRLYSCYKCRNHLALHDDIISKGFQVIFYFDHFTSFTHNWWFILVGRKFTCSADFNSQKMGEPIFLHMWGMFSKGLKPTGSWSPVCTQWPTCTAPIAERFWDGSTRRHTRNPRSTRKENLCLKSSRSLRRIGSSYYCFIAKNPVYCVVQRISWSETCLH